MSIELAFRGGRLSLSDEVGSGATSRVWRATLNSADGTFVNHPVAVKVARSAADRTHLATEVERLLWSNSYGTGQLIDAGRVRSSSSASVIAPDAACVVLSWVGAETLEDLVPEPGERAEQRALQLARDIGEALGDLHQAGFAHGDVKPANVVAKEGAAPGAAGRFVLVDLGLSDDADNPRPRGATPRYLAPEALGAAAKGDGRTRDIWALGVVLAETARGQKPSRAALSNGARRRACRTARHVDSSLFGAKSWRTSVSALDLATRGGSVGRAAARRAKSAAPQPSIASCLSARAARGHHGCCANPKGAIRSVGGGRSLDAC